MMMLRTNLIRSQRPFWLSTNPIQRQTQCHEIQLRRGLATCIQQLFNVADASEIPSPALLFDHARIAHNLDQMVAVVGKHAELRPHVKTHKTRHIVQMQLDRGITKVKCATIAEMEVCAAVDGLDSILLAYQPVGPTIQRLLRLVQAYSTSSFAAVVDSVEAVTSISEVFATTSSQPLTLWIDVDCGMHRTGVSLERVKHVVKAIYKAPGVTFGGIHAYDGHLCDTSAQTRSQGVEASFGQIYELMNELQDQTKDETVSLIASGSPTVAIHGESAKDAQFPYEISPGTTTLWDAGYASLYPELEFICAAQILTRVVSKPTPRTVCLDLGHKAVAAEKPLQNRVVFPSIPDAKFLQQSEEHLVIETDQDLKLGDIVYGIPVHICPTVALYDFAHVVDRGEVIDRWPIEARSRQLNF